jgi:hypothetical protein
MSLHGKWWTIHSVLNCHLYQRLKHVLHPDVDHVAHVYLVYVDAKVDTKVIIVKFHHTLLPLLPMHNPSRLVYPLAKPYH